MKGKLIAIDVDGTLLDETGLLKDFTRQYLSSLSKQGVIIVLASGRPTRSLLNIYKNLGCFGPFIAYNGALIHAPADPSFNKIEYRFDKGTIKQIYKKTTNLATSFLCESKNKYYFLKKDWYLDRFFPSEGMAIIEGDISLTLDEDPFTCIFKSSEENKPLIRDICEGYKNICWRSWRQSPYSELYLKGVDKALGLKLIMDHYGINRDEVIAFGDADNDLNMLNLAGKAYAMKGCKSDILKTNFPLTIETVENEGVALTLKQILS